MHSGIFHHTLQKGWPCCLQSAEILPQEIRIILLLGTYIPKRAHTGICFLGVYLTSVAYNCEEGRRIVLLYRYICSLFCTVDTSRAFKMRKESSLTLWPPYTIIRATSLATHDIRLASRQNASPNRTTWPNSHNVNFERFCAILFSHTG